MFIIENFPLYILLAAKCERLHEQSSNNGYKAQDKRVFKQFQQRTSDYYHRGHSNCPNFQMAANHKALKEFQTTIQ
jgi:hypothetical protein